MDSYKNSVKALRVIISLTMYSFFLPTFLLAEDCPKAFLELKGFDQPGISFDDKKTKLENIIKLCPTLVEGYYELGRLYFAEGQYSFAENQFKEADKLKPRLEHILGIAQAKALLKDYVAAEALYKEAIGRYAGHWSLLEGLGVLYLELGKYQEAEELFRQGLQDQSTEGSLYYNLGIALDRQGRIDESLLSFRTALEKSPLLLEARVALMSVLYERGDLVEAKGLGDNGILHDPQDSNLLFMQIQVLDGLGEISEALRLLDRISDNTVQVRKDAVRSVLLVKDDRMDDAQAIFDKWVTEGQVISKENYEVARAYGWVLVRSEKYDKAEKVLEKVIAVNPDDASSLNNLALAYEKLGKVDVARDSYRRAATLLPLSEIIRSNQEKLQ